MSMLLQTINLSILSWILSTSAKASIFIFLLIGVKFLLRHKMGARFQYTLWVILMIGLILPWTPKSPLSLYNFLDSDLIVSLLEQTSQSWPAGNEDNQYFSSIQAVDMNSKAGNITISSKTQKVDDNPSDTLLRCISQIDSNQFHDYASTLVQLAETYSLAPKIVGAANLFSSKSQIKRRIIRITELKPSLKYLSIKS